MSNVNSSAKAKPALRGNVRKLVMIAMLSAVAFILMFVEVSLPFLIPSFVKMDVSDLPALIGSFSMGPVAGIAICVLKNVLHIVIKGTSTACAGEICNALLGITLVVPASLIYRLMRRNVAPAEAKRKGRIAALVGCIVGSVAMGVLSVPINYFITYPAYIKFYGMPLEAIIGMYQQILPSVKNLLACLVIFNMPFTFVKGILCSVITFLIYKPISGFIKGR
ncbi:MAG: ECF transporter S component [Oscillospiraceae bacterium]|nr:ECF transporter S component [Oscillospiraceae bacterium]